MYAELNIEYKEQLPQKLVEFLIAHFGTPTDLALTLAKTTFAEDTDIGNDVVYQKYTDNVVFVVFKDTDNRLRFHFEVIIGKSDKHALKNQVQTYFSNFSNYLKRKSVSIKKMDVQIYAEQFHLYTGTCSGWLKRIWNAIEEDLYSRIFAPIITGALSYSFNYKWQESLMVALFSILALLLWAIVKATFLGKKDKIDYISEL